MWPVSLSRFDLKSCYKILTSRIFAHQGAVDVTFDAVSEGVEFLLTAYQEIFVQLYPFFILQFILFVIRSKDTVKPIDYVVDGSFWIILNLLFSLTYEK